LDSIRIKGARQHNLKNIDLELPRRSLVVVSGVSGSGKSSLVFDTLYQESRRRFLETLPTYVLQLMERIPRPEVDEIQGLSPAVAVEQHNPVTSARSTVGTLTEIYDYLRLLFARAGTTICPACKKEVRPDTTESVVGELVEGFADRQATVSFGLPHSRTITPQALRENLLALGFIRVLGPDGGIVRLDDEADVACLDPASGIRVVVDRLKTGRAERSRLAESVATAFHYGEGALEVILDTGETLAYSQRYHCAPCDRYFPEPAPNFFSFNNPYGACPVCRGFGDLLDYDLALVVPDERRSVAQGALDPWTKPRYEGRRESLREFCRGRGIDTAEAWHSLPEEQKRLLLYGDGWFEGVFPFLRRLESKKYKQYIRFFLRGYQSERTCPGCGGSRLRPETGNVRIGGRTIHELAEASVQWLAGFLSTLAAEGRAVRAAVAGEIIEGIASRLDFMLQVGLGYLTLSRLTRTLSGGEYQRIMLTRLLGSGLTDTLFVLDEPTVGLHQRDTARLVRVLEGLVRSGNSLVVVEHDAEVIRAADHVVELGPGSGENGGQVLFSGPAERFLSQDTATARSLRDDRDGGPDGRKRRSPRRFLQVSGARLHNLKGETVRFGLGAFNCLTGVSGSGKSSLAAGVLEPALNAFFKSGAGSPAELDGVEIQGAELLEAVVMVDQSPIGRTPRSNPVTYIKAFDHIRKLFAASSGAKRLGLAAGDFSFNTVGGRCERCKGAGFELVDMQFMADVLVPCEECGGKRFARRTLTVACRGMTIDRVLEMTVNEAIAFFADQAALGKQLWVLQSVGLGYLRLGQSATTLSGGESQRLKIARQLIGGGAARSRKGRLFILDEPTTGLHAVEVARLLRVLDKLVESGHTVLVVEHHPAVICHADWIVDLGPEGGDDGGRIVVQGPPEEVARCRRSHTGRLLAGRLKV